MKIEQIKFRRRGITQKKEYKFIRAAGNELFEEVLKNK
jgi:hypothetical protein